MKRPLRVSGRLTFLSLLGGCVLFSIIGILMLTVGIIRSAQKEAMHKEAAVLIQAIKVTLNNDVLTSNLYAASDRLNGLVEQSSRKSICFRVQAADGGNIYFRDDGGVCSNSSATTIEERVYFDKEQTALAFTVSLSYVQPSLSDVSIGPSAILILIFGFILILLLVSTYRFAQFFFDRIYTTFEGKDDSAIGRNWLVLSEIERIKAVIEKLNSAIKRDAVATTAAQVAHDIRSPLSALNLVLGSLQALPEDKRIIVRSATQRINDIANTLLNQSKNQANGVNQEPSVSSGENKSLDTVLLIVLLDSVVSEKRVQYRERMQIEIQGDLGSGHGLFAQVNPLEFSRVLSNLINNSVESFESVGRVNIGMSGTLDWVSITITDNGKGIPASVLSRIGERGVSHGKEGLQSGTGLGIFHARQTVEAAGGSLLIESSVGVGTTITIKLPRAETPKWFVEKLTLDRHTLVASVDDDQTIHQVWHGRLTSVGLPSANHIRFSSLEAFEDWARTANRANTLFLVDFEFLGQSRNGIDVIESLGVASRAILVTSRYEEPAVRVRAEALGVRILPKGLAPLIPVRIEKSREKFDAIIIDDDSLQHAIWTMAAKGKERKIWCFSNAEEFLENADNIDPSSPLFIDVSLANGVRGEAVAIQAHERGFEEIYLATGHSPESLYPPAFIRGVIGKGPVF